MFAAANKVDNYIATIDYNGRQIDGDTEVVLSLGNLRAKFEAFGWDVLEVNKGNDMEEVLKGLNIAKTYVAKGKPVVII